MNRTRWRKSFKRAVHKAIESGSLDERKAKKTWPWVFETRRKKRT